MPSKRTKEQQAAYMREYRARKAAEFMAAEVQQAQETIAVVAGVRSLQQAINDLGAGPNVHAACDAKIADLEARLAACVLASATEPPFTTVSLRKDSPDVSRETIVDWPVIQAGVTEHPLPQATFLRAPDEDCVCGHDRHSYHLTGPCTAYVRPKTKCPCTGFMADLGFG